MYKRLSLGLLLCFLITSLFCCKNVFSVTLEKGEFIDKLTKFSESKEIRPERIKQTVDDLFKNDTIKLDSKNLGLVTNQLRNIGLPVCNYRIEKEELHNLPIPYIVIDKKVKVVKTDSKKELLYKDNSNTLKVITYPYTNIEFIKNSIKKGKKGNFYIIYSYHDYKNFKAVKKILENLREKAEEENKKLVYVDELGLIPEESVEKRKNRLEVPKKEAFSQIKQAIFREDKMLEKGIPLNIGSEFYQKLYSWLAEHRVKSLVEDLKYINWKNIIEFDNLRLGTLSRVNFYNNNMKKYIRYMHNYCKYFWFYNVELRDRNFANQVKNLVSAHPSNIYLTIRGIGHYGLEEVLAKKGIDVTFIAMGNNITRLERNLVNQQVFQVYASLGIKMTPGDKKDFFKFALMQELLRAYFIEEKEFTTLDATLRAKEIVNEVSYEDVIKVSKAIKKNFKTSSISGFEDIYGFVYKWLQKKEFILKKR